MSDRLSGTYKIRPLVIRGEAAIGVSLHKPAFQPIRVGGDVHIWNITPNENGSYHLSLKDKYPYTGVLEGQSRVIATIEEKDNREWRISYQPKFDAYIIELYSLIWPARVWSLSALGPGAEIVIRATDFPRKESLFKLEPVHV